MFVFRSLIELLILYVMCDHLKCNDHDHYSKGLFPPPKYDFINESEVKFRYERCLTKIDAILSCDLCVESREPPELVDNKMFCCFYYKQIDCTFGFLLELFDEIYNKSDTQYINGYKRLTQDLNQTLERMEAKDECILFKSTNHEDCEKDDQSLMAIQDYGNSTHSGPRAEEEAWSVVLGVTCFGCIVIGITLFLALIYLTKVEKKHFNAIRNSQTFERIEYED